jgi:hypothetical protein
VCVAVLSLRTHGGLRDERARAASSPGAGRSARADLSALRGPRPTRSETYRLPGPVFQVAKALTGTSEEQVPADTVFTVRYTYETNGTTVSQDLPVPADGTVGGPQSLPEGTVVTFEEVALPGARGSPGGTPTVTVDESTPPVSTMPGDDLASTGADVAAVAALSALFVALGLLAVALRRRAGSGTP